MLVAVAAGLGMLAFFVPFLESRFAGREVGISPYRLVVGFDDVGVYDPALRAAPEAQRAAWLAALNASLGRENVRVFVDEVGSQPSRVPYFFLAVAVLIVAAAHALARRQLGLLGALAAIGGGLGAIGGWSRQLLLERETVRIGAEVVSHLAPSAVVFLIAGVVALIGGVGALCWPDPGGYRARRKIFARLVIGEGPVPIDMPSGEQDARVPRAELRRKR